MLSKKPFGFVFFLVFFIFLFLDLFLFYQTTRLLVPYPILLQFRPDLSISTYAITLFALMSKMALSLLLGYLLPICQPISLRSLLLHPFLYVIATSWVFLFLLNNFIFHLFFYFISYLSDLMGVCWDVRSSFFPITCSSRPICIYAAPFYFSPQLSLPS